MPRRLVAKPPQDRQAAARNTADRDKYEKPLRDTILRQGRIRGVLSRATAGDIRTARVPRLRLPPWLLERNAWRARRRVAAWDLTARYDEAIKYGTNMDGLVWGCHKRFLA